MKPFLLLQSADSWLNTNIQNKQTQTIQQVWSAMSARHLFLWVKLTVPCVGLELHISMMLWRAVETGKRNQITNFSFVWNDFLFPRMMSQRKLIFPVWSLMTKRKKTNLVWRRKYPKYIHIHIYTYVRIWLSLHRTTWIYPFTWSQGKDAVIYRDLTAWTFGTVHWSRHPPIEASG